MTEMQPVSLKDRLQAEVKTALKAREKQRLGALRLMMAEIKQQEIDRRSELDDCEIIAVLDRMVKQRRDSAGQFRDAGRNELADLEEFEIGVIQEFMPRPLAPDEILELVKIAIDESGAVSVREMGKVMNLLKPRMQGRADMAAVSREVRAHLDSG